MAISVFTEITDAKTHPIRGWVLYDGECQFCLGWVRRMTPVLAPRGFAFLPLQTLWVRAFLHLPEEELLGEMRVLLRDGGDGRDEQNECAGQAFGGADAILELAKHVWWAWPLAAVAQIQTVRNLLRAGYRAVAARRYCVNGRCSLPPRGNSQSKSTPEGGIRI
jgi:predicted DCC family thiol-disulfide oxidoreductase YuxK